MKGAKTGYRTEAICRVCRRSMTYDPAMAYYVTEAANPLCRFVVCSAKCTKEAKA